MQNFNGEKTLEFTFLSEKEKKTVCLKSVNKPMKSSSKCVKGFILGPFYFLKVHRAKCPCWRNTVEQYVQFGGSSVLSSEYVSDCLVMPVT